MPTYRLATLGCKVSRADAASIERALRGAGFAVASRGETADLCVVSGCAVTAVAEGKSRRAIRRLGRENPGATVVAAGCIAEREESSREAGAEFLVGPDGVPGFIDRLREMGRWRDLDGGSARQGDGFPGRTRAFLKVQDGCDGGCAYCIVPRLRGPSRSVPAPRVMDEAKRLVDAGHAEIVVAGVRLGSYSDGGTNLAELVEGLLGLDGRGLARLRLSSIEPMDICGENEALADIAASVGIGSAIRRLRRCHGLKRAYPVGRADGEVRGRRSPPARHTAVLCPHFHLPVQSGDDEVLARMNRPYRTADFRALVERLRSRVAHPAITTDVIAGFPGETEEAHARSLEFIKRIGFARVHAFPFSPRPGTAAAEMLHEPGTETARRRTAELVDAGRETARAFRRRFVGATVSVLAEPGGGPGRLEGYTERYVRVAFDGPKELVGRIVGVHNLAEVGDVLRAPVRTAAMCGLRGEIAP